MKNLNLYPDIRKLQNSMSGVESSCLYINGIAKNQAFDANGNKLTNENGDIVLCTTPNFTSVTTRSVLNEKIESFYIQSDSEYFDYTGLAIIGNEVVWVERDIDGITSPSGLRTEIENEIKIKVLRGINNTKPTFYPKNTIIRSVVNMTSSNLGFHYEENSEIGNLNLFKPVVSSGNVSIMDNIQRWSAFLSQSDFLLKKKLPIYIFQGSAKELVCDYVGFISDFEIDTYDQQIDISFENKFSLYFEEKINSNKIYKNKNIKEILSDVLDIPMSMISYPVDKNQIELYTDEDFFTIEILTLHDYNTYQDFLDSICKELCIRISFNSNEKLIIQSDIKKLSNSYMLSKYRYIKNTIGNKKSENQDTLSTIREWNDILVFGATGEKIPIIKAEDTSLSTQETLHRAYDGDSNTSYRVTKGLDFGDSLILDLGEETVISSIRIKHEYITKGFYENNIVEVSRDKKTWYKVFDSNINGEYLETSSGKIFSILPNNNEHSLSVKKINETDDLFTINTKTSDKIIINKIDGKFIDRSPYYNKEDFILKSGKADDVSLLEKYGDYDIGFVNDDAYLKKAIKVGTNGCRIDWIKDNSLLNEDVLFRPVKYNFYRSISNIKIIELDAIGQAVYSPIQIYIGENIQYLKINESFVLLTDGANDFMCKVADITTTGYITIIPGYDTDKDVNYFGKIQHLQEDGYLEAKVFVLYYGRTEYCYVSEWKKGNTSKTNSVNFPLKYGEVYNISGNFGGIDTPEGKFNGIVGDIESIYGTFTKDDLLYSREFSSKIPIYVKSNDYKVNRDYIQYSTFDNSNLALSMSREYDEKQSQDFSLIKSSKTKIQNANSDYVAKFVNLNAGFKVITKKAIGNIPKNQELIVLKMTESEIKKEVNQFWKKFKVVFNETIYFIDRDLCSIITQKDIPKEVLGIGIKVEDASYYGVGDLLTLSSKNLESSNTIYNYKNYSSARWTVVSIIQDENVLILDYEYPKGLNNENMEFDIWKADKVLVLQEFKIKGNPYIDVVSNFFHEDTESIKIYGEKKYSDITGKMINKEDLKIVTSYLLNSFGATNINNTKGVVQFETIMQYDLDVLDIIELTDKIFTGYNDQKAIITSKKIICENGETKAQYEALTLGSYDISDNLLITSNFEYAPTTLPIFTHTNNSGEKKEDDIDMSDSIISKFDKTLGSISILQINQRNLVAKVKTLNVPTNELLEPLDLYNVDSNLKIDEMKKYTDILLTTGKKLFIKIKAEFMYVECISSIINDDTNQVSQVSLKILNRGVFDTENQGAISKDSIVAFYQITQISSQEGLYSTGSTFGDIEGREYFKFDAKEGVGLETSRGYLNISTEGDWVDSLRTKFELPLSMTDNDVLDYTGRGMMQIGNSSTTALDDTEWEIVMDATIPDKGFTDENYNIKNTSIDYNYISEIKIRMELDDDWVEVVMSANTGLIKNPGRFFIPTETGGIQFNEVCNIISIKNSKGNINLNRHNVKGKIEIWSNWYVSNKTETINEGNEQEYDVNDSPVEYDLNSYLNGKGSYQIHNLTDNEVILAYNNFYSDEASDVGIGNNPLTFNHKDYTNSGNAGNYKHKRIIVSAKIPVDENNKKGFMRYTRRGGLEVKGNVTIDSGAIKINDSTDNNFAVLNDERGWLGIGTSTSEVPIGIKNFFQVGSEYTPNYIKFEDSSLQIHTNKLHLNTRYDDDYFIFDDNESSFVLNNRGNKKVRFQIGSNSYVDSNHISYDGSKVEMRVDKGYIGNYKNYFKIESTEEGGKLFLNEGAQQIGSKINDGTNNYYSGLYIGETNGDGAGRLDSGRYIKYDGDSFQIGANTVIAIGDNQISSLNQMIEHSSKEMIEGTTTISDNIIKIYSKNKYREETKRINNVQRLIQVKPTKYANKISASELGYNDTFGMISDFANMDIPIKKGKFIQLGRVVYGGIRDTFKLVKVDSEYIYLSGIINTDEICDLYVEEESRVLAKIGDLSESIDTGEFIRLGLESKGSLDESVGLKIVGHDGKNFLKFNSKEGFYLKTEGTIDITNGIGLHYGEYKNRLFFNEELGESFISMDNGAVQLGKLDNISSGLNANGKDGFFVGDNKNLESYMAWIDGTLQIKGNLDVIGGTVKSQLDDIGNSIDGLNTSVRKGAGNAYVMNYDPITSTVWIEKDKSNLEHVGEIWINSDTDVISVFTQSSETVFIWKEVQTQLSIKTQKDTQERAKVFFSDTKEYDSIKNNTNEAVSNDLWIVLNKETISEQEVYSATTYIYSPKLLENDRKPINQTLLSDWIVASTDNSSHINLSTGDSTLYFDSRINTVDKIELAKTGSRGYFSVGNTSNHDYLYYSANDGIIPKMDISTSGKFSLRNFQNGQVENKIIFDSSKNEDIISMKKGAFQIGKVDTSVASINYKYDGVLITDNVSNLNDADNLLFFNMDKTPNASLLKGTKFYLKTQGNISIDGGDLSISANGSFNLNASSIQMDSNSSLKLTSGSNISIGANSGISLSTGSVMNLSGSEINIKASSNMNIDTDSNFNINTDNLKIKSRGEVLLQNDKNLLYFKKDGADGEKSKSMFQLNTVETDNMFQLGSKKDSSYLVYNDNGLEIGGTILSVSNDKNSQIQLKDGVISFFEKNKDNELVNTRIVRKMAYGIARDGDLIDLLEQSNGAEWKNPTLIPSIKTIATNENEVLKALEVVAIQESPHTFRIKITSSNFSVEKEEDDISWISNRSRQFYYRIKVYCSFHGSYQSNYFYRTIKDTHGLSLHSDRVVTGSTFDFIINIYNSNGEDNIPIGETAIYEFQRDQLLPSGEYSGYYERAHIEIHRINEYDYSVKRSGINCSLHSNYLNWIWYLNTVDDRSLQDPDSGLIDYSLPALYIEATIYSNRTYYLQYRIISKKPVTSIGKNPQYYRATGSITAYWPVSDDDFRLEHGYFPNGSPVTTEASYTLLSGKKVLHNFFISETDDTGYVEVPIFFTQLDFNKHYSRSLYIEVRIHEGVYTFDTHPNEDYNSKSKIPIIRNIEFAIGKTSWTESRSRGGTATWLAFEK